MNSLKKDWSQKGYDLEELYFEKVNRELIQKLKHTPSEKGIDTEGKLAEVIPFPRASKTGEKKKQAA